MKSLFDRTKVYLYLDHSDTRPDVACTDGIAVHMAEENGALVCVFSADGERLCFEELLASYKENALDLCIFLDTPLCENAQRNLLLLAQKYDCTTRLLLVSRYHKTLDALLTAEPNLRISPLCDGETVRPWVYAAYLGASVLCMDAKEILRDADPYGSASVDRAHNHSVYVFAMGAEDEETCKALVSAGCDAILTHDAAMARKLVW